MKPLPKIFFVTLALELLFCANGFAAKKDFKGLFGSYRREKFTENEGNAGEFGIDLMVSTLLPMTPVVQGMEASGGAFTPLNYATFFNVEGGVHYAITYNWLAYLSVGYYDYDTRKKVTSSLSSQPTFQQFEMQAMPVLLGAKYRFSASDIVPYLGFGIGLTNVTRKGFYDFNTNSVIKRSWVPSGQIVGGFEFYFSPKAGIRMEISALYLKLNAERYNESGADAGPVNTNPAFELSGNIWSVRYASGLFFMF